MKLIEKLLANYIELPFVYAFYFMYSMFMPLSSIRWFYIMIAISVVSLFFVCAGLYFDIKNKKKRRKIYWVFDTNILLILSHIAIYIDILTSVYVCDMISTSWRCTA